MYSHAGSQCAVPQISEAEMKSLLTAVGDQAGKALCHVRVTRRAYGADSFLPLFAECLARLTYQRRW